MEVFLAAASTKLEWVQDALSAESHALKQGLVLARTLGCNRIIFGLPGSRQYDAGRRLFSRYSSSGYR
jgi:hypothetical protein